jgi:CheY-like chemotaxis protein
LLGLINDVLDMSRIESGKTRVKHESFDMRTCIDNCISIIGGQLATRDLEMVRKLSKFQHPCLIGDELHLRQIFINILGNSVKFTPDGGKIFFRAWEKESTDEKALYRFELADTGIGMKEEFLPHLFEAFAQEDDGTRTTYKGTGLGMAITKEFVELMGGTIEVESKLNVGTEFAIEIWFDIDQNARIGESMVDVQIDLVGMKVLLVEDIDLNMEIAQCMLEDEGAEVTPAMNGQEAVDAFSMNPSGTFDIIIMDIMMPVMDGITAAKTIRAMEREDAKTIPIIAMTANAYEEDIQKTHDAGMNAHLSKPIDIDLMLKTLAIFYSSSQEA